MMHPTSPVVSNIQSPLDIHTDTVCREWIDYNEHMNLAYYVIVFDRATDVFFDYLGLDAAHREATNYTPYALECHVNYERELRLGDRIHTTTQLLDFDEKRLHFFHAMYHSEAGYLAATTEMLFINVDRGESRATQFTAPDLARIELVMAAHKTLPEPTQKGRVIAVFVENNLCYRARRHWVFAGSAAYFGHPS